jgi:hypothetical protein
MEQFSLPVGVPPTGIITVGETPTDKVIAQAYQQLNSFADISSAKVQQDISIQKPKKHG